MGVHKVPGKRSDAGRKGKAGNATGRRRASNKAVPPQPELPRQGDGLRVAAEEDETWEADASAPLQSMTVDGMKYELKPYLQGATVQAFVVLVNGKELSSDPGLPKPVVCRHLGSSADARWCVLAPNGVRLEADNRVDMFSKLAKLVNG
jgi:hypothetical protein